jgi:hypothetical protein
MKKADHPEFTRSLQEARRDASLGYYWIASLWINRAKLYGKVTSAHLKQIGIKQTT